ncbi:MAG: SLC13 family permease [Rhodospirillales bacterium]|nr:SLC13 family permease [Rhodospirillales bacterium]
MPVTFEQGAVFGVLAAAMLFFIWGRWRYDIVALLALMSLVLGGIIPAEKAFLGFSHPAVITVAAVLVIGQALKRSGVVQTLVRLLAPSRRNPGVQIAAASSLTAVLSAFMNNVGALALMLPVALRNAYRSGRSPSQVLMPLSFASLLGGLITLIGTPPNIIIATFRGEVTGTPFAMFDFAPVGLPVAVVGLLFVSLIGWRLLPSRRPGEGSEGHSLRIQEYLTEATIPLGSKLVGQSVRQIEQLCDNELTVMAIIRGAQRLLAPSSIERLIGADVLILEGDPAVLEPLFDEGLLKRLAGEDIKAEQLGSDDVRVVEAVLMPHSPIEGQSMRGLRMHDRYGINLLAVARRGHAPMARLSNIRFRTGDVLLLQGERENLHQVVQALGCLPLAERGLELAGRRGMLLPMAIFAGAIASAALGHIPVQVAFVAAVAALVLTKTVSLRDAYQSIEWPIIVLLGALIPIGEAMQDTGGTALIAAWVVGLAGDLPVWMMLGLLMVVSMALSDLIHNSPTAVLMAPIAVSVANGLNISIDPCLIAVAVGSASPYLSPIGHQSNTLVMGPGGYRFGDYCRMGLPLDLLILAVGVPLIMWVWMP